MGDQGVIYERMDFDPNDLAQRCGYCKPTIRGDANDMCGKCAENMNLHSSVTELRATIAALESELAQVKRERDWLAGELDHKEEFSSSPYRKDAGEWLSAARKATEGK